MNQYLSTSSAVCAAKGFLAALTIGLLGGLVGLGGAEFRLPVLAGLFGLVTLPTMIVGSARYRESTVFAMLRTHCALLPSMAAGLLLGALLGGLPLGVVLTDGLGLVLALILVLILALWAWKVFRHRQAH